MKANENDRVVTTIDMAADFSDRIIPRGTHGTIVECYRGSKVGYAVDLELSDETLVGGYSYENVILTEDQFELETEVASPGATD